MIAPLRKAASKKTAAAPRASAGRRRAHRWIVRTLLIDGTAGGRTRPALRRPLVAAAAGVAILFLLGGIVRIFFR